MRSKKSRLGAGNVEPRGHTITDYATRVPPPPAAEQGRDLIDTGIALLWQAIIAHGRGQPTDQMVAEFWSLANATGPSIFATAVRDGAAWRLASALARDNVTGDTFEILLPQAIAACGNELRDRFGVVLLFDEPMGSA
jgi:hypothetical protein